MLQSSGGYSISPRGHVGLLSPSPSSLSPGAWTQDLAHGRQVLYHSAPSSLLWMLIVEEEKEQQEWLVRIYCVRASDVGCLVSLVGTPNLYCRGPLLNGGRCGASQAGNVPGSPTKPGRRCWVSLPWFLQLCRGVSLLFHFPSVWLCSGHGCCGAAHIYLIGSGFGLALLYIYYCSVSLFFKLCYVMSKPGILIIRKLGDLFLLCCFK